MDPNPDYDMSDELEFFLLVACDVDRVQVVAATVEDIRATLDAYLREEKTFVVDRVRPESGDQFKLEEQATATSTVSPRDRIVPRCDDVVSGVAGETN